MGFGAPVGFGFGIGFDLGIAWSPVAELAAASSRSEIRNYVYSIMATEAMMDGAVCLMCLMRLLMWLLAHAVDGGVDLDGCFVLALCFFGGRTNVQNLVRCHSESRRVVPMAAHSAARGTNARRQIKGRMPLATAKKGAMAPGRATRRVRVKAAIGASR